MRKASPTNNLALHVPLAIDRWDYHRNPLAPEAFLPKSNKDAWWICERGHSYKQRIANFTRGVGCPYCAGYYASEEDNLLLGFPELIQKSWDYKRNSKAPQEYRHGSEVKVWWKCEKHKTSWQARIPNMTKGRGTGCSECHFEAVREANVALGIMRSGSLGGKFPDLIAQEWDYEANVGIDPSQLSVGSGIIVWWKCRGGHKWATPARQRTRDGEGTGCPKCNPQTSRVEVAIRLVLEDIFASVEANVDFHGHNVDVLIKPKALIVQLDGYPWHLHTYERDFELSLLADKYDIRLLRIRDLRLPKLQGCDVLQAPKYYYRKSGLKELIQKLIDWVMQELELNPQELKQAMKWCKPSDEVVQSVILRAHDISRGGRHKEEDSLLHRFPEIAKEAISSIDTSRIHYRSNLKVEWQCMECDENWETSVHHRTKRGTGCPSCARAKHGEKFQRQNVAAKGWFGQNYPHLIEQWDDEQNRGVDAQLLSAGSQVKVWWKCEKGHVWKTRVKLRTSGSGCPKCARRGRPRKSDNKDS